MREHRITLSSRSCRIATSTSSRRKRARFDIFESTRSTISNSVRGTVRCLSLRRMQPRARSEVFPAEPHLLEQFLPEAVNRPELVHLDVDDGIPLRRLVAGPVRVAVRLVSPQLRPGAARATSCRSASPRRERSYASGRSGR